MTKNDKDKILNFTKIIIKKIDDLKFVQSSEACEIVEMLDKLEDYLIDEKGYKTKFKEDIRYLRYLMWSMAAAAFDGQGYYQKVALKHIRTLRDKLRRLKIESERS